MGAISSFTEMGKANSFQVLHHTIIRISQTQYDALKDDLTLQRIQQ